MPLVVVEVVAVVAVVVAMGERLAVVFYSVVVAMTTKKID